MAAALGEADKERISAAIRSAESRSRVEFVTVIASASDRYRFIPLLWSALIALAAPALLRFALPSWSFAGHYMLQIVIFLVLAALFQWPPLKMRVTPPGVRRERARRFARDQFFEQGLHLTEGRTGLLLFVSEAERYVEIIADAGISEHVADDAWHEIVRDFIHAVRSGRVAEGFVAAVEACGRIAAERFPAAARNPDELPNHLIEVSPA